MVRRIAAAALVVLASSGCMDEMPRPSVVDGLRILGLRAEPADAIAGEPIALELLVADPRPPCGGDGSCPAGSACLAGRCEREGFTEIAWLLLPLAAFEAAGELDLDEAGGGGCLIERCPPPMPCERDDDCPGEAGRCREGLCAPCFGFGPATFCCGEELTGIEAVVPELEVAPPSCDDPGAVDLAQLLIVQAQVCAGGEIDLCVEAGQTTFGCVGQGAEAAVARSRLAIVERADWPNAPPDPAAIALGERSWAEDEPLEVRACLDERCAERRCGGEGGCEAGQRCSAGICREVVSLELGEGAAERYLLPCDEPAPCAVDADCAAARLCEQGRCMRVESPLVAFYATGGTLEPGRVLADQDADGLPDTEVVETEWTPPVLEPCAEPADPCPHGPCDVTAGRCTGEVTLWAVVRDGRGGQAWVERRVALVP